MTKKSLERIVGRKVRDEEYLTAELVLPTMSDYMDENDFLDSFKNTETMCGLVERMAEVIEDLLTLVSIQRLGLEKMEKQLKDEQ